MNMNLIQDIWLFRSWVGPTLKWTYISPPCLIWYRNKRPLVQQNFFWYLTTTLNVGCLIPPIYLSMSVPATFKTINWASSKYSSFVCAKINIWPHTTKTLPPSKYAHNLYQTKGLRTSRGLLDRSTARYIYKRLKTSLHKPRGNIVENLFYSL